MSKTTTFFNIILVSLVTILTLSAGAWLDDAPDPTCSRGLCSNSVCCPLGCGQCGGRGCRERPLRKRCCRYFVIKLARSCSNFGPPCVVDPELQCQGLPSTPSASPSSSLHFSTMPIFAPSTLPTSAVNSLLPSLSLSAIPSPSLSISQSPSQSVSIAPSSSNSVPPSVSPSASITSSPSSSVSTAPSFSVSTSPSVSPPVVINSWTNIDDELTGVPRSRHENCFVMVGGKGYLIGGRGTKNVEMFNPKSMKWVVRAAMPTQMHHMQCVGYRGNIYIPTSWYGGSPSEEVNEYMWVYSPKTNSWTNMTGLPSHRRRGGAASVLYKSKIWVIAGNIGGHGPPSQTLGYLDYYDLVTNTWVTELPDLPEGRDHVGAAVVKGQICIAGGRDGGVDNYSATIASTYCYNVETGKWKNMDAPIPTKRAGAATARTCDGKMMVVGGEGPPKRVYDSVEVFDGTSWEILPPLVRARHGTGLSVSRCSCGHIFITAGSGWRGGRPELNSTERYIPPGRDVVCSRY